LTIAFQTTKVAETLASATKSGNQGRGIVLVFIIESNYLRLKIALPLEVPRAAVTL
jgi:hypothetical protein